MQKPWRSSGPRWMLLVSCHTLPAILAGWPAWLGKLWPFRHVVAVAHSSLVTIVWMASPAVVHHATAQRPPAPLPGTPLHPPSQASTLMYRRAVEWLEDAGKDALAGDVFRCGVCLRGA